MNITNPSQEMSYVRKLISEFMLLLIFVIVPVFVLQADEPNPPIVTDAGQINDEVMEDAQTTRKRTTRDNKPGDKITEPFTLAEKKDVKWWINKTANPDLQNKQHGEVFFAYVLGKGDDTSALVKAHTTVQDNVVTFQFDVIQGQIDSDGESKIDFMTELTFPDNFGGKVALKTNYETLPNGLEGNYPSNNEYFDNVLYKEYQDRFLLNSLDIVNNNILAQYLPSHLLYSPEDYTWDPLRLKLVKNGDEELATNKGREILELYQEDVCDSTDECTIGEMLAATKSPNNERTPILFIHILKHLQDQNWQLDKLVYSP